MLCPHQQAVPDKQEPDTQHKTSEADEENGITTQKALGKGELYNLLNVCVLESWAVCVGVLGTQHEQPDTSQTDNLKFRCVESICNWQPRALLHLSLCCGCTRMQDTAIAIMHVLFCRSRCSAGTAQGNRNVQGTP